MTKKQLEELLAYERQRANLSVTAMEEAEARMNRLASILIAERRSLLARVKKLDVYIAECGGEQLQTSPPMRGRR